MLEFERICREILQSLMQEVAIAYYRFETKKNKVKKRKMKSELDELFFIRLKPKTKNLYTPLGIPQTHNAWDMQYLIDQGKMALLYNVLIETIAAAKAEPDFKTLSQTLKAKDYQVKTRSDVKGLYQSWYERLVDHMKERVNVSKNDDLLEYQDYLVLKYYIKWSALLDFSVITLDLFPTSTTRKKEDFKDISYRLSCDGYESYSRVYANGLCARFRKIRINQLPCETFGVVVPYTNSGPHILWTNALPMDAAENALRIIKMIYDAHDHRAYSPPKVKPQVFVCGFSQAGAAVRIVHDFLCEKDLLVAYKVYLRSANAKYRNEDKFRIIQLGRSAFSKDLLSINTLALGPMGGITLPPPGSIPPEDHKPENTPGGRTGAQAYTNTAHGYHLSIGHDLDPVQYVHPSLRRTPISHIDAAIPSQRIKFIPGLKKFDETTVMLHGGILSNKYEDTDDTVAQHFIDTNFIKRPILRDLIQHLGWIEAELQYHGRNEFIGEDDDTNIEHKRANFPLAHLGIYGYPMEKILVDIDRVFIRHAYRNAKWPKDIYPYRDDEPEAKFFGPGYRRESRFK